MSGERVRFWVNGPVVPYQRVGPSGRKPAKSRAYQKHIKSSINAQLMSMPFIRSWDMGGKFAVSLQFWFPDKIRRDLDNCEKQVLDAMVGLVFDDDSWTHIPRVNKIARLSKLQPGVIIDVVQIGGSKDEVPDSRPDLSLIDVPAAA